MYIEEENPLLGCINKTYCSSGCKVEFNRASSSFIAWFQGSMLCQNICTNGIRGSSIFGISISPNPARSIFTLDATQEVLMIDIMNLLGERVSSIEVNNTTTNINISQYKTGVYLAKIIFSNGNIQTIKFIKE